jgi:DNA-binding beta-propeller fold protein YncE
VTDGRGFVLHPQIGAVSLVDLNTKEVISTLSIGPDPRQIAVIGGRAFIVHAAGFLNVVDGYGRRMEQLYLPINDLSGMTTNVKSGLLYLASAADQKIVALDVNTWTLAHTWTLDTMPGSLAYNEVTDHLFVLDTTSQYLTVLSGLQPERIGRIQVNNRPASDSGSNLVVLQGKIYIVHPSNDSLDVWLDRTCGVELAGRTQTVVAASYSRTDLAPRQVEARIGILWPHGGATPEQATFANLTATLIREDGASPACGWEPTVTLWAAIGDDPAQPVATGQRRLMTEDGVTFPVYDFNDVDVRVAHEAQLPIHFTVQVDGVETSQNVWTHAASGQYLPTVRPELEGMVARNDGAMDARLWVEKSDQGPQVYAILLRAGTMLGIAQGTGAAVPQLRWSLDNNVTEPELIVGQAETRQEDGFIFTVWRFPGLNPDELLRSASQARFWVEIPNAEVNSSFFAWGQEIRTLGARLPIPVVGCRQEIAQR